MNGKLIYGLHGLALSLLLFLVTQLWVVSGDVREIRATQDGIASRMDRMADRLELVAKRVQGLEIRE